MQSVQSNRIKSSTKQSACVETGAFPWRVGGGKFGLRVLSIDARFARAARHKIQVSTFVRTGRYPERLHNQTTHNRKCGISTHQRNPRWFPPGACRIVSWPGCCPKMSCSFVGHDVPEQITFQHSFDAPWKKPRRRWEKMVLCTMQMPVTSVMYSPGVMMVPRIHGSENSLTHCGSGSWKWKLHPVRRRFSNQWVRKRWNQWFNERKRKRFSTDCGLRMVKTSVRYSLICFSCLSLARYGTLHQKYERKNISTPATLERSSLKHVKRYRSLKNSCLGIVEIQVAPCSYSKRWTKTSMCKSPKKPRRHPWPKAALKSINQTEKRFKKIQKKIQKNSKNSEKSSEKNSKKNAILLLNHYLCSNVAETLEKNERISKQTLIKRGCIRLISYLESFSMSFSREFRSDSFSDWSWG